MFILFSLLMHEAAKMLLKTRLPYYLWGVILNLIVSLNEFSGDLKIRVYGPFDRYSGKNLKK